MSQAKAARKRYVVLPDSGIMGKTMMSSVFKDKATQGGSLLTKTLLSQVEHFARVADAAGPFAASAAPAAQAAAALAEVVEEQDFSVVSQSFEDGPAVVKMTQSARLALKAAHPGLRIFPITRYRLPGDAPKRPGRAGSAAAGAASTSAVQPDGTVFLNDIKQHYLKALDGFESGSGVTVAVLDSGVDRTHPALSGRIAISRCLIPGAEAQVGRPVDWGPANASYAGHGTHVAGIIAAEGGHGGPAGVAPGARIADYRIFPDSSSGRTGAENAVIIDSIRAAMEDGCQIINLSIEGSSLREDGVRSAVSDAWANGVVCIAAAGNGRFKPVSYPAALQHCVAVTAIGRDGCFPPKPDFTKHVSTERASSDGAVFLAAFSNFGPQVKFTAPGHAIVSTFPGNDWWFDSGTSMAAPFVAGVLARLLSANGNILNALGDENRSAAMQQMLIGRARLLGLPQVSQEGYGLPI